MKVIVIVMGLIAVVMMVIFILALMGMAGRKTAWEQMLEDADQRRCIEEWMQKKGRSNTMDKVSKETFVQNVETSKPERKGQ